MTLMQAEATTGTAQDKPNQPPPNFWDPIPYLTEVPTSKCLTRVEHDIWEIEDYSIPGMFISAEENDITKIHALILGPTGTPYEGGFFHFLMKCLPDYPDSPPRVRLMTTDAGSVRFGPSFYENGKVCLGLLGTSSAGTTWSSGQCLGSVLFAIKSLLTTENPVAQGSAFGVLPALGTWLSGKICYNAVLQHETIRVAVCDVVECCLRETSPWPPAFRDKILKHFPQFYTEYERAVKKHLHLTGSYMNDSKEGGVPTYQFETLLQRLAELREKVRGVNDAAAGKANE
ncbi:ubiquitin-conjugating enzyme E2 Z-like [Dermacentor albipictus]|uniref:ubiquitin-conjugating enzyme E2 Z-like n=1 Tax=Dermacentor albipictus TaxID=60249 RepID=UPI0031FD13B4